MWHAHTRRQNLGILDASRSLTRQKALAASIWRIVFCPSFFLGGITPKTRRCARYLVAGETALLMVGLSLSMLNVQVYSLSLGIYQWSFIIHHALNVTVRPFWVPELYINILADGFIKRSYRTSQWLSITGHIQAGVSRMHRNGTPCRQQSEVLLQEQQRRRCVLQDWP